MSTGEVESKEIDVLKAAGGSVRTLSALASHLIAFSVFGYVIGWIELTAYLDAFGAAWLAAEHSPIAILAHSWLPGVALLIFMWLGATDLAEARTERRERTTVFMLRNGWFVLAGLLVLRAVLRKFGLNELAYFVIFLEALTWLLLVGGAFEAMILRVRAKSFGWNRSSAALIYSFILIGFWLFPSHLGRFSGEIDKDPLRSSLPVVTLRNQERQNLRLLFAEGERFYAVQLSENHKATRVLVFDRSEVEAIHKVDRRPRNISEDMHRW